MDLFEFHFPSKMWIPSKNHQNCIHQIGSVLQRSICYNSSPTLLLQENMWRPIYLITKYQTQNKLHLEHTGEVYRMPLNQPLVCYVIWLPWHQWSLPPSDRPSVFVRIICKHLSSAVDVSCSGLKSEGPSASIELLPSSATLNLT